MTQPPPKIHPSVASLRSRATWSEPALPLGRNAQARAWQHFEERAEEDTYFSLEQEIEAVSAAGFVATCVWVEGRWQWSWGCGHGRSPSRFSTLVPDPLRERGPRLVTAE